ncbi:MAG: NAD-dependent epimerase/dehydratase family protein [Chitinophagaceae bacterium]
MNIDDQPTPVSAVPENQKSRQASKILVTGGTGFLGAYIIQNLVARNLEVRAIKRSSSLPFFISASVLQKVEWVNSDVLDVVGLDEAMQGCYAVIHAAAIVSFNAADRQAMEQVNIEGTRNVVNAAIENNIDRFVHISSVAALGRTTSREMISESKSWEENKNTTQYARTKHHAELEVWRGFSEGLNGVILNPSTILGFGNWHTSSCALFKNAYKGFSWYSEGINGFVGVEDVATAAVEMLLSDITEKRFIVNSDNWSFRQLFEIMAAGFGKKPPHLKATPFLGELAWRLEGLKHLLTGGTPLLTKESTRVAQAKTSFDSSALLQALPVFRYTPLTSIIKNSCEKYKEAVIRGEISA